MSGLQEAAPAPLFDLIELMFFAYRDFVGDADRLLEAYGFGRAHHRVLHFVSRRPGLTVAELLDILQITKQSLARVMKELLDGGFVTAHAGLTDRRQRLLFVTPTGEGLANSLARLQSERFRRALADLPPGAEEAASQFLFALVDREARAGVAAIVWPEGIRSARLGRR
ncbi:MarR family winged helix-turn-helix transcriptional regulator [Lichenifustis flavocetrariae]|uniref:MarR family transcriptional regulator n=1 Tax=Lichenifustis flavocetrariae TaxID=2949735 RepID=A0AA41YR64_9HYPH|nr:MarR family transcriptional regulator [Lichenifustis flavocetrariae]MCW6507041.1 MarR family transcriptional regulator [Lichenifustis flavocetrariae]